MSASGEIKALVTCSWTDREIKTKPKRTFEFPPGLLAAWKPGGGKPVTSHIPVNLTHICKVLPAPPTVSHLKAHPFPSRQLLCSCYICLIHIDGPAGCSTCSPPMLPLLTSVKVWVWICSNSFKQTYLDKAVLNRDIMATLLHSSCTSVRRRMTSGLFRSETKLKSSSCFLKG